MTDTPAARLRALIDARRGALLPGAANALTARLIEDLGFEACYVTGAGVTNTWFGLPDQGFMGLTDMAHHVSAIRDAVELPLVVDADTGFGNAVNTWHAVRTLERAGANAIQLEDQVMPKRCGHFTGKAVIPAAEMAVKIRAATDARRDEATLIMARTDARAIEGLDAAIDRARSYREAGADIIFLEAPTSAGELARVASEIDAPQLVNLVVGGRTPLLPRAELAEMGFSLVLYANVALQAALAGMTQALTTLKEGGDVGEGSGLVASFQTRQSTVRKPMIDGLEAEYEGG
ncbi:carboxyvinyl-carboxyphosphonate phosphorylmutase [Paracoccus sp. S-4012]|uniref:isocitrate lyase/PEP mutase family protein n=1 Tax=Paracoccus sp. S-4012 TaxID=2665648 RepID=UPI0012B06E57|nr:oxaloacetate decarboxylase [Paracoccus sp. S-4012]MRX48945.1 carboxyvinyl-carboxyphosphonate phosphorylmutase [Paracoccus sp. S-4012]